MKLVPSVYQERFYSFTKTGKGNAVISSVAGSGKTTTIVESLKFVPRFSKVIFLAFNKAIVEELKSRIPRGVDIKTFHSLGCGSVQRVYAGLKLNDKKFYKYSDKHLKKYLNENFDKKTQVKVFSEYREFVNCMRNNAIIIPRNEALTPSLQRKLLNEVAEIESSNFNFEFVTSDEDYLRAIKLLHDMNQDKEEFDFTDMIYYPLIDKNIQVNMFKYDLVIVDECQDMNLTQQKLFDLILKPKGRFVAVGDKRQAIYGFAGSDTKSFEKLSQRENTSILLLSICYRCHKNIIRYAKGFIPEIEFNPTIGEGIIRDGLESEIQYGDMVLGRLNKTLIKLFFSLVKQKKKCYIKGKDIGEGLIKFIMKSKANSVKEFTSFVNKESDKLKEKIYEKIGYVIEYEFLKKMPEFVFFSEKVDCIMELYNNYSSELKTKSFQLLSDKIYDIFKDEGEGILLSTVHKAKGLENERVFIADGYNFPSQFSTEPWQLDQELNLYYVAITRAKSELVFLEDIFMRKIYRYLLLKEYDKLEELFKSIDLDIKSYFFLKDLSGFIFDFKVNQNFSLYSKYQNSNFISLHELKQEVNGITV